MAVQLGKTETHESTDMIIDNKDLEFLEGLIESDTALDAQSIQTSLQPMIKKYSVETLLAFFRNEFSTLIQSVADRLTKTKGEILKKHNLELIIAQLESKGQTVN